MRGAGTAKRSRHFAGHAAVVLRTGRPARLTGSFETAPAAAGQGAVGRQPGDDGGTDKPRAVPAGASHFPYPLFSCMGRPHL